MTARATQEVEKALKSLGFETCLVHIQKGHWGGIWHPLSLQFDELFLKIPEIQDDCLFHINQIQLKIPLSFLWSTSDFSFQEVDISEVSYYQKALYRGHFSLSMVRKNDKMVVHLSDCDINATDASFFYSPLIEITQKMDIPLRGEGNFWIHPDSMTLFFKEGIKAWSKILTKVHLQLSLSRPGMVQLNPFYPMPLPIQQLDIDLSLQEGKLRGETSLRFNETRLQFHVKGEQQKGNNELGLFLQLRGMAHHIPLDRLSLFWPVGLATNARTWVVENLSKGSVPKATINMDATYDLRMFAFTLQSLSGEIDASNVVVRYLDDLPSVFEAYGHCTYTNKDFRIKTTGKVNGLDITRGDLLIYDFDKEDERITIDLDLKGPLERALDIISQKPLALTQKLGLTDPSMFQGNSQTHLLLDFPLRKGLPLEKINVVAQSKIDQGRIISSKKLLDIESPYDKKPLEKGQLTMLVDNQHLELSGEAHILSHPSHIQWIELFSPKSNDYQTVWSLSSQMDLDKEGLWSSFLQGKALIEISQKRKENKTGELTLKADLKKTHFDIPYLSVMKAKDDPLTLQVHSQIDKAETYTVTTGELKGKNIDIRATGAIKRGTDNTIESNIRLKIGQFGLLQGNVNLSGNFKALKLSGKLKQINVDQLLLNTSFLESSQKDFNVDVLADIVVENVLFGDKLAFNQVACHVHWAQERLQSLHVKTHLENALEVILAAPKFHSSQRNTTKEMVQSFSFSSHNAGDLLDYIYPENDLEGGIIHLVGNRYERSLNNVSYEAEMDVRDVVVKKAPFLAHLLSAASLNGLFSSLSGSGIQFDHCSGKLEWTDAVVKMKNIHFSGGSLGLNFSGSIDRHTHDLQLTGELYPFNGLNYLMANIPVLGGVLSGGNKKGVFSTHFQANGPMADPIIMVNPLTTLTPGGVRRVFREATTTPKEGSAIQGLSDQKPKEPSALPTEPSLKFGEIEEQKPHSPRH